MELCFTICFQRKVTRSEADAFFDAFVELIESEPLLFGGGYDLVKMEGCLSFFRDKNYELEFRLTLRKFVALYDFEIRYR